MLTIVKVNYFFVQPASDTHELYTVNCDVFYKQFANETLHFFVLFFCFAGVFKTKHGIIEECG